MDSKTCKNCKKLFFRKKYKSGLAAIGRWSRRKYCSRECSSSCKDYVESARQRALKKGYGRWMKGRKMLPQTRIALLKATIGRRKSNPRSTVSRLVKSSKKYKEWREAVFERDNWTCQGCDARSKRGKRVILHPHHIKPFSLIISENSILGLTSAYLCKTLWDVSNGQTLCRDCHKKTESYGRPRRRI